MSSRKTKIARRIGFGLAILLSCAVLCAFAIRLGLLTYVASPTIPFSRLRATPGNQLPRSILLSFCTKEKFVMLYRAQDVNGTSRLGYAESSDGVHFTRSSVTVPIEGVNNVLEERNII
jgi:hypothetical protein